MKNCLIVVGVLLLAVTGARADLQVQEVEEATGTGIQYTDHYYRVTDPGKWEALVDHNTGAIFSFLDLTDNGVQVEPPPAPYSADDHVNYTGTATNGTDYCYHLQTPLLALYGRSGSSSSYVFSRKNAVSGLADRLSFSWNTTSFTITYTETGASEDFVWDPAYYDAGSPGDILTTATLVLNAADAEATVFRMTVTSTINLPAEQNITGKVFAEGGVRQECHRPAGYSGYAYGIDQAQDEEDTSHQEGAWNGADPKSFSRRTISNTQNNLDLGLIPGRVFILDHVQGYAGYTAGGTFSAAADWANGRYVTESPPFTYGDMAGQTVKTWIVDLRINIISAPPVIDPDQCAVEATTPHVADGSDDSTVTITIRYNNGMPVSGLPATDVVVSVAPPTGISLTQPSSPTDSNGQTTATFTSTNRGVKTVSATVNIGGTPTAITDTANVLFYDTGVMLTYADEIPDNSSSYNYKLLVVTARRAGVPFSQMKLIVPLQMPGETTHAAYTPGIVVSCKDLMIDSDPNTAFEYTQVVSPPAYGNYVGMLQWGGSHEYHRQPSIYQNEVQDPDYLQFEILTPSQQDGHPSGYADYFYGGNVRGTKVVKINKPSMYPANDGYTWAIEGSFAMLNTSAGAVSLWGSDNATGNMNLRLNSPAGYDGVFVNPSGSTTKPNVHDSGGPPYTDDHPLYSCADWYGTTVDLSPDPQPAGGYLGATVKSNANTTTLGMWPGALFELRQDDMDFYYPVLLGGLDSGGTQQQTGYIEFNLEQRGIHGSGFQLEASGQPGDSVSLDYEATIDMPGAAAVLEISVGLDYTWVYQNTAVMTGDRHLSILTITLVTEAQPGESYTVLVKENGGALTNFTLQTTAQWNVLHLLGGRMVASTPGTYTLDVTVTGLSSGQQDTKQAQLTLRNLGDIDGNGFLEGFDKVWMNMRLNGVPTAYPERAYDLSGEGTVDGFDKVLLNMRLNGITPP